MKRFPSQRPRRTPILEYRFANDTDFVRGRDLHEQVVVGGESESLIESPACVSEDRPANQCAAHPNVIAAQQVCEKSSAPVPTLTLVAYLTTLVDDYR